MGRYARALRKKKLPRKTTTSEGGALNRTILTCKRKTTVAKLAIKKKLGKKVDITPGVCIPGKVVRKAKKHALWGGEQCLEDQSEENAPWKQKGR